MALEHPLQGRPSTEKGNNENERRFEDTVVRKILALIYLRSEKIVFGLRFKSLLSLLMTIWPSEDVEHLCQADVT